jgi:HEAT repeat protein
MLSHAIEALGNFGPLASDALPMLEGISKYDLDDYTRKLATIAIAKIDGTWEGEEES